MGNQNYILLFVLVLLTTILHFSRAQNSPHDFLNAHNRARAQVGVRPMTWDNGVAAFAQNYANQRQGDCQLMHSKNRPYGENLAVGLGLEFTGVDAVKVWVDEKADYDYDSNTCALGKVCGQYTQVVWKNSVRLGCARVQCNNEAWNEAYNEAWFVTCNYDPPGNYVGQKPGLLIKDKGAIMMSNPFLVLKDLKFYSS